MDLIEDVGEGLEVADQRADKSQNHTQTRDAVAGVVRSTKLATLGLGGGDVHHGREHVDDGAAEERSGERDHEAQVVHHHGDAGGSSDGADGEEVILEGGGLVAKERKGAGTEAVENKRVGEGDARPAPKAAQDRQEILAGIGVEDEGAGVASEGQEAHHHDEGADDSGGREGGVDQGVELAHGRRLDLVEEAGGVIVGVVRRVQHRHEDEGLDGLEGGAIRREAASRELLVHGTRGSVLALEPAEGHEDGDV
mmetsp:Transcript_6748/g.15786  ORF Transcript_6748/g.15786 Transcript_6748/m.15786 type:complete len:253 (+) Transcript_6748:219-977(+)